MKLSKKDIQRFWNKVDCSGGKDACWPWCGNLVNGYGHFRLGRLGQFKTVGAHRVSCFLKYGQTGKWTCHHCDNPKCCNPSHLYPGSAFTNNRDCVKRGRHISKSIGQQGEQHWKAKLTKSQILQIRNLKTKESCSKTAQKFNLHRCYVWAIQNKKAWKHL